MLNFVVFLYLVLLYMGDNKPGGLLLKVFVTWRSLITLDGGSDALNVGSW